MKFGLEVQVIENIISVLEQHPNVDKAFVFGSRAKGNYRPDSDIDIAIKGNQITTDDIIAISVAIETKGITHKFDLIDYNSIKEPALKEHIDRVGIEFYSNWKEYKLEEIATIQTGPFGSQLHMSDYKVSGTPIITVEHLGENKILHNNLPLVSNEDKQRLIKYTVKEGDIVFSRVGSVDRRAYVSSEEDGWMFSGRLLRVRVNKDKVCPKFLSFYFGQESFKETIRRIAVGATMPSINTTILSEIEVVIPQKKEQTAIASILSSLDDKIDLLQSQNKTLEQLAETMFRQWFVEEAEENWEVEKLGKVFDIGIGRTPPRKEQHWFTLNPNDVKWVSIKDMGTCGIYIDTVSEYLTQAAVEQYSVPVIPKNTVMLSFKMTIGRLAISTEKMVSNEAIAHFKQKEGSFLFPEFLYLFLKTYSWVELGSTSSIVESINSQMIKDIEIAIPDEQKLNAFKDLIKPYFDKIRTNQTQIRTLTQTRDTLLPKLMSGEVRV
jgi:type I restriction enzyme S subunit